MAPETLFGFGAPAETVKTRGSRSGEDALLAFGEGR
jgi:hypothetical protein